MIFNWKQNLRVFNCQANSIHKYLPSLDLVSGPELVALDPVMMERY